MIGQFLKHYSRLSWFLGVPTSILGILFLIRFYFSSQNSVLPIPGTLSPNNSIKLSGIKNFSLDELQDEVSHIKKMISQGNNKGPVSLTFPNKDSIYKNQFKDLKENSNSLSENYSNNARSEKISDRTRNSPISLGHVAYYSPSQKDILEIQEMQKSGNEKTKMDFNSYSKPEKTLEGKDNHKLNDILKTRLIGDQSLTEGTVVQLITIQDYEFENSDPIFIPKNTVINAYVSIGSSRIVFHIHSVKIDNKDYEIRFISEGPDESEEKDIPGMQAKPVKQGISILDEAKNQIINETAGELASTIPIGSSVISGATRNLLSSKRKLKLKLPDGFEIHFLKY